MARINVPISNLTFGLPIEFYGGPGVTLLGSGGGTVAIKDQRTFIAVVNNGPIAGTLTIKAQPPFTIRPADSVYPQQATPDLNWAIDDNGSVFFIGPIPPSHVNAQGYCEIDLTDDGMGGDLNWQFRAIRLV